MSGERDWKRLRLHGQPGKFHPGLGGGPGGFKVQDSLPANKNISWDQGPSWVAARSDQNLHLFSCPVPVN